MTIQRRNRGSFARKKPIPTDPQTALQLAQRQIYRDAVAVWNALSLEEKEAWRGVCPGLTAYQCFMRSELKPVPPPPEEYTEEQTEHNANCPMKAGYITREGQRLTISNRKMTKLGFWLFKHGEPTGDVLFVIRKVSDDSIICSKLWGDASDLPTEITYEEVQFDDPQTINEEVRILCEFSGAGNGKDCALCYQNTDVKSNELRTYWYNSSWSDRNEHDDAYRYKYYLP